jgi:sulfur-carrier protein
MREGDMSNANVRVMLPYHLRNLAKIEGEITLSVAEPVSIRSVLDALEASYPMLRGTIRDYGTLQRRPFLRFFACEEDLSLQSPDTLLPDAVVKGKEPVLIIGAIAGGAA